MKLTNILQLPFAAEQISRFQGVSFLAVVFLLPFLLQGCAEKQVRVRPWATAIAVRPHLTGPRATSPPDLAEIEAPDFSLPAPRFPSPLIVVRQPVRPRVPVQPAPETAESHKPLAPLLEPELTPQELAVAQQQMNESIAIAQKNLNATKGRSLNPTQADLTSKVNSFLQESKQAVHDGDWTRARNLAKKAQVLSEELAASL
jgi:hypothetical protein